MIVVGLDYVAKTKTRQSGLHIDPVPMNLPALDLSMPWSPTLDNDPGER